jgi:hypothetical protein
MKKLCSVISFFISFVVISSCANKDATKTNSLILYEDYQIIARKDVTEVNAVVFFQPNKLENDNKFFPQEITYNDNLMQLGQIENYSGPSFSLSESNGQTQLKPKKFDIDEKSIGYMITLASYTPESNFVVTDLKGNKREFRFKFEPTDFEQPNDIVLSRSKDNYIQITGQCSNDNDCSANFDAQSADFENKDLKIDFAKKQILVPAETVKKLKGTQHRITITSKTLGFINETVHAKDSIYNSSPGSNYSVIHLTDSIAKIVN